MSEIKISELNYLPDGIPSIDSYEIPVDNGQMTYRINVEDFNEKGTLSAQNLAAQAAASAQDALDYKNAAAASETNALSYKNNAAIAKDAAETAASNALIYENAAERARNDAISARDTINTAAATVSADVAIATSAANDAEVAKVLAQTAASNAASSSSSAEAYSTDSEAWARGTMDGVEMPSGTPFYHNNSKWYSEQAASSASAASGSADAAAASASAAATYTAKAPYIGTNGHWYVWDATNNQYVDTNINATGPAGNGIASVAKTGSSGKVDYYTITFTDGTTFPYTVTNGEDGQGSGDMLMTDYDHDQYVFNAGGIPSYVSTQITSGIATKMNNDGSNAANLVNMKSNVITGDWVAGAWTVDSITKAAGDNQDVVITEAFSTTSLTYKEQMRKLFSYDVLYESHIGDENVYFVVNDENVYVVIDTVTYAEDDPNSPTSMIFTVTGHLKEDDPAAINLSSVNLNFPNYISSTRRDNVVSGLASAVSGNGAAVGQFTDVLGNFSYAEGDGNAAYGNYHHVEGRNNTAAGSNNHIEGYLNFGSGSYSHVEGQNNATLGANCAYVGGYENSSAYSYQHISGKYNDNKASTLLEVGNGTADNARSNVFEVYNDGFASQNNGTDKFKFGVSGGLPGYYHNNDAFASFDKVSVATSGTASSTGAKKQQITINGTAYDVGNSFYMEQSVTLSTSADVTCTFTNAGILATSRIDPYTSVYGITPSNVVASNGSCTVTFKKVSSAQTITVGIEVKN